MGGIYTLMTEKGVYGNFHGGAPIKACRKIFAKLCRMKDKKGVIQATLTIMNVETKKIYSYFCVREELEKPKILNFGTVHYKYNIKKI